MKITSKLIKFNQDLLIYKKDQVLRINCDSKGIPLKKLFRDLIKDSEIDNCISVISEKEQRESVVKKVNKTKPESKPKKPKTSEVMRHDAS